MRRAPILFPPAILGAAVIGLALLSAPAAPADPVPPDPSLIAPVPDADAPPPPPISVAELTRSDPMGILAGLLGADAATEPSRPTVTQTVPPTDPLSAIALLMPQNFGMPTGEEPSPYVLSEGTPSPFARIDAYQGVHALLHGALGRMPGDHLGQPLPGTAPPLGTAIPPGLVQNFPGPTIPPEPGPAPLEEFAAG